MKHIYVANENIEFWLQEIPGITVHQDFDAWQSSTRDVAMIEIQQLDGHLETIRNLHSLAFQLVIFVPEFIDDNWIAQMDWPNTHIFVAGFVNWVPQHAQIHFHGYFFWSTTDFYHALPGIGDLSEKLPNNKPKQFDVLLGRKKPHRDRIYRDIDHDVNVVTYFNDDEFVNLSQRPMTQFVWPSEILPDQFDINFTGSEVIVDGVIVSLSQIIPVDIYEQTRYSLVAETQHDNGFAFFTEKIIKPMMARRIFLVSAGQGYLANLRRLGFETFHSILDESYDDIVDPEARHRALMQQVQKLSQCDADVVYLQCMPILDHNHDHVMRTNWLQCMINDVARLLID